MNTLSAAIRDRQPATVKAHPFEPQRLSRIPEPLHGVRGVMPVMRVAHLGRSRAFYESLGFSAVRETESHLTMQRADVAFQLRLDLINPYEPVTEILFWVDDVDTVGRRLNESVLVHSSGERECQILDPDGAVVRFAQVSSTTGREWPK